MLILFISQLFFQLLVNQQLILLGFVEVIELISTINKNYLLKIQKLLKI